MILTLLSTVTADDATTMSFKDEAENPVGTTIVFDNTYAEYMFVFTDIGPATDNANFLFQVNATDDAGGGFDTSLITSTYFSSTHNEGGSDDPALAYETGRDQAQGSAFQDIGMSIGNGSDESLAGILRIFMPSSTTFVKHWYATTTCYGHTNFVHTAHSAGYINDTTAIDEIQFKMSSGNWDGTVQMYGIA